MDYVGMLVYVTVAMVTPGPNNLMTMYLFARHGARGARKFMVGSTLGLFVKMLLCGALNFALAAVIPAVVPWLKWLGAAYMIFLAVHMARDGFRNREEEAPKDGESTYRSGILLQCLNMKSWIFALSVFSIYVVPYGLALLPVLICVAGTMVLLFVSFAAWGFFGSTLKHVCEKHRKGFGLLMGVSLVWCAVTALI